MIDSPAASTAPPCSALRGTRRCSPPPRRRSRRQTWSPPRYLIAKPTPVASGMCPPTMPWPPRKFRLAVEQVHRAALAARAAVDAAEQLGHHRARRHAARERLAVIAVGRDDVVVRAQHRDRAGATASWPMYRWQKPPILPSAYASAQRSSKRRWSSIERSSSRRSVGVGVARVRRAVGAFGSLLLLSPCRMLVDPARLRRGAGARRLTLSVLRRRRPAPAPRRDSWSARAGRIRRA